MSLIKDPDTYAPFDRVILVHGCRVSAELAYREFIAGELPAHELLGELVRDKLVYFPTVTREAFHHTGRVTDLLFTGSLSEQLGLPPVDPEVDRIMLCGSPGLLADFGAYFKRNDWLEGSANRPGQFVIEKAFVEK